MTKRIISLGLAFIIGGCSPVSTVIQPQINGLVVAGRFDDAIRTLEQSHENYGTNNRMLYELDYGLVLHLAGRYQESIRAFERAKQIYDQLYTHSISKQTATWLVNDYAAPYRGEDFERVLINVFQALNYACLNNVEEALVEARDADSLLYLINSQYSPKQKNVYREDAFVRFLMGILYESQRTPEGYDNAYISYTKALEIYNKDFSRHYDLSDPALLKENLLSVADAVGGEAFLSVKKKLPQQSYRTEKERARFAEVYVVYYEGFSPIKHPVDIPIPIGEGRIVKLAFPRYDKRESKESAGLFEARGQTQEFQSVTRKVYDIGALAMKSLADRRARVIAKAVLRSGLKYFAEKQAEQYIQNRAGENAGNTFRYISNLYNIMSEQADLRSWQTLPGTIRMARLLIPQSRYDFFMDNRKISSLDVLAGKTYFLIYRRTGLRSK